MNADAILKVVRIVDLIQERTGTTREIAAGLAQDIFAMSALPVPKPAPKDGKTDKMH